MKLHDELGHYLSLGLTIIPLESCYERSLFRWGNGWNLGITLLQPHFTHPANVWVRCGQNLAVIYCGSEDAYLNFIAFYDLPSSCPVVKNSRCYHIWVKPKTPIRSELIDGIEINALAAIWWHRHRYVSVARHMFSRFSLTSFSSIAALASSAGRRWCSLLKWVWRILKLPDLT